MIDWLWLFPWNKSISMKKIWCWLILLDILITKQSCDLVGRKHISVYNLQLCVLNWGKTLLLHSKPINLWFPSIFFLFQKSVNLLLVWPYTLDQLKPHIASLGELGCDCHTRSHLTKSMTFKVSLPWWLSLFKRSKTQTDSFQTYWW